MENSFADGHMEIVGKVVEKELGEAPTAVRRMTVGTANEVYVASLAAREVIVRLNADEKSIAGAEAHIALFKSKGIPVAEVIASDYSKSFVPFAYQIQSKLAGHDIGAVISTLGNEQLRGIAREIASIVRKLAPLPTNGKFGWSGGSSEASFASWLDVLKKLQRDVRGRTAQTGIVDQRYMDVMDRILEKYHGYFKNLPSTFYYDDMCSKNVLIHEGKFVGLVDLDTVAYGDLLEGIGRIEACWHGTEYGRTYADAVMTELELDEERREMVSVYAVLNRIYWLSERGIKFNENTSTDIDYRAVAKDKQIIDAMLARLNI